MTDQAPHRPDLLQTCYDELPSLQELLNQLDKTHTRTSADGKKGRRYSNSRLREYFLPNLFPIFYMLAVLTWLLIAWLQPKIGSLPELAHNYGIPALQILFFLAMIQFMWNAVGLARFYFKLSTNYISSVQSQMAQEDLLAYRLHHLPPKALKRCRERVELEIEANEKTKFAVAVLPVIPVLVQIWSYLHRTPVIGNQEVHLRQVLLNSTYRPSNPPDSWSVSLGTTVIILVFLDLFYLRMGRKLRRLAHVLYCAESDYSS